MSRITRRDLICRGLSSGLLVSHLANHALAQDTDDNRPCVDKGSAMDRLVGEQLPVDREGLNTPAASPTLRNFSPQQRRDFNFAAQAAPQIGGPARAPARMAVLRKWNTGQEIRISFIDGTQQQRSFVQSTANEWTSFANLRFRFENYRANDPELVKIGFQRQSGNWSYIGREGIREAFSEQRQKSMNLDFYPTLNDPRNRGLVLHEFGHMLGCVHEHQSPARQNCDFLEAEVIRWFQQNTDLQNPNEIRRNVLERYRASDLIRFSQLDRTSIMMYHFPAHLFTCGIATPQNNSLSSMDQEFIRQLYPGSSNPRPEPGTVPPATNVGSPLTVDSGTVTGTLVASGQRIQHSLTITTKGTNVILTSGSTQVRIRVLGPNGTEVQSEAMRYKNFFNDRFLGKFDVGAYMVEISHASPIGIGTYGIEVKPFN